MTKLTAVAFICTLKPSPEASSTEKLTKELVEELAAHDVATELIRMVDYTIKPGVEVDMGEGDDWPALRKKMLDADILIFATPTWVGQMTSVALGIIERLDAELSETDDEGRLLTYGKVAAAVVVGNEDGAHKISADLFQALNDVGFTLPAQAVTYWNGEAMQTVDYKDLKEQPEKVTQTNSALAKNIAHMAQLLKQTPYPAQK